MDSPVAAPIGQVSRHAGLLGIILAAMTALWAGEAHAVLDTPPVPDSPASVVMLLKWCWQHRDAQRYRDLFTADFQFASGVDASWGRDQELATVSRMFGSGTGTQAGAATVSLEYLGLPLLPGSDASRGGTWPWHQQVLVPEILDIGRNDGSGLHAQGLTLFYVVRGDLAAIPPDMQARGFRSDSTRWYIERWEDEPEAVTMDHAPVITAPPRISVVAGRPLTMDVTVFDQEEDPILSLTANTPLGASFVSGPDNTTGHLSWTPTTADVGDHVVTLRAANQLWSAVSTKITVRASGLRAALSVNPSTGNAPLYVRLDASGSTSPNAIGSYVFDFGDGSSMFQGYPVIVHKYQVGTWTAKVTATDSQGWADSAKATVVVNYGPNQPPSAALRCTPTSGRPPLSVTLDASAATDADGHIVRYKFAFGDGKDTTQTTPIATHVYQLGHPLATVMVYDDKGDSASASAPLDIHGDRPPVLTAPATRSVMVGVALTLDVSITDPDGDPISTLTANIPAGATFVPGANNRTGRMTWTPTTSDVGIRRASFTAANALTDSVVVAITVAPRAADRPPVVTALYPYTGKAGKLLTFTVTAFDPDSDPITSFTATLPPGAQFTPGSQNLTGTFAWTPTPADIGTHVVRFTASNALSGWSETSVVVRPPNVPPVASLSLTPTQGTEPVTVNFYASGSYDPDGRIASYRFDFGDGTSSPTLTTPWTTHTYSAGVWRPRVTVTDDDGASAWAEGALEISGVRSVTGALDAINRLESSWKDRNLARYRELLASDYRFVFAEDDPIGDRYPGRTWTREDELLAAGRLFVGGYGAEPPAASIAMHTDAPILGTSYVAGREYPWHVQVLVPIVSIDIDRGATASPLHVQGRALFSMVRGDSAQIPQELVDLGFHPDSTQWYVEGWRDMTGLGGLANHPPVASIAMTPTTGMDPLLVRVDASRSHDDDGTIRVYQFDFGDGAAVTQTSPICAHTFRAGQWRVTVTATDDQGVSASAWMTITVSGSPPRDRPPVVTAPTTAVTTKAGKLLTFSVGVSDPDSDPITSLTAALPAGAQFTPGPQNLSGTFSWTPTQAQIGTHVVTFTASNALSGTAQTFIDVRPSNVPPVASLSATPTHGTEPLSVSFYASGSYDPDGRIASYRFDFGDGTSTPNLAGPSTQHTYSAGIWRPRVTVTDDEGATNSTEISLEVSGARSVTGALDAIARLESSWRDRNLARYRELLTSDYRFVFATDDSIGDLYPGRTWTRDDELLASGRLFAGGYGVEPPAASIALGADSPILGTSYVAGREYPWHVQVLVPNIRLDIDRGGGGPPLHVQGRALFSMVRGDSAQIPQELVDLGFHPDSTQWYVEGWRDMTGLGDVVNQAPVVSLAVTPATGMDLLPVRVDASRSRDEDGTIQRYRFDFGDGVAITQSSPICTHTFHAGQWNVTVTATDDRGAVSSAGTMVTVWAPGTPTNLARNPSFEADLKGWNSYAGSLLERVQGGGHDGNFGVQVTGPPVINGSFGVNDSPDMVRWTLGPGIRYRYTAWVRSPSSRGRAVLRVTEYLIAGGVKLGLVTSPSVTLSPDWQQLTVDYTTTAANSTLDFQVRDFPLTGSEVFVTDDIVIRNVTGPGAGTGMASWYDGEHDPVALEPRLVPSPMHGSGVLRFMTSQPGALSVEVLDIAGRRVRQLMDERDAPAGLYDLSITRLGDDGHRLGAGMYFWRIRAREGMKTGRFVMLQ